MTITLDTVICTKDDVRNTYLSDFSADKTIDLLDEHNIFPLTYKNGKLALLNILGALTYFTGSLESRGSNFSASISCDAMPGLNLEELFSEHLGLKLRDKTLVRKSGTYRSYGLGENGASYSRLLKCMGWPVATGRKAKSGTFLPQYLKDIVDDYKTLSKNSKTRMRKYVCDVVDIWLMAKSMSYSHAKSARIKTYFMCQPTEEEVRNQANFLVDALNMVYPSVNLSKDKIEVKPQVNQKYGGFILFGPEELMSFPPISPLGLKAVLDKQSRLSINHNSIRF